MASDALTFHLDADFLKKVQSWPDPYEGNPLGKFVYERTYSRYKNDDSLENWAETCQRVVEGCYTLQREHIENHSLGWDDDQGQASAQEMYERLYHHKFLASGRALWALGTPIVHNKELDMALYNCSFISTKDLEKDPTLPFCFLMDVSMLGTGCGADTKGKDKVKIYEPIITPNQLGLNYYTVDDTREGWVDSVRALLNTYFIPEQPEIVIDYSQIRPEGQRLKTFGGMSSGSKPLEELHDKIRGVLMKDYRKSGKLSSTGIIDIFNLIGVAVVAGNVRRCKIKGTLVHLTRGLIKIEDVKDGDEVITSKGTHRVIGLEEQGEQEIVKIITQLGETEMSIRHEIKVFNSVNTYEFKMAQDLQPGDRLVFSEHVIPGVETRLPTWHYEKPAHSTTCKDLIIPPLDTDMAWFLGYFLADGYVYPNWQKNGFNAHVRFAFAPEYEELLNRCQTQMERFDVRSTILNTNKTRDRSTRLNVQSKQFAWYLSKFKVANESLNIPTEIMTATPDIRGAFLAGILDADGCIRGNIIQALTSVYPLFVKQIQVLYASLGIPSRLRLQRPPQGNWKALFSLHVCGVIAHQNCNEHVAPYSYKMELHDPKCIGTHKDYSYKREWIPEYPHRSDRVSLKWVIDNTNHYDKCIPIEVKEIRFEGKRLETYDLAVDEVHEFIYDEGLYTSNTAEIMFGEHDDQEFLDLKNYEVNPHRMAYGWSSNNSVLANLGMDYASIQERIQRNAEPGLAWLENMQKYGRMKDPPDWKDKKVLGGNPCFPIDTVITTSEGLREIKDLIGKPFVAVIDGVEYPSTEKGFFKTGENRQLYKMELENGIILRATDNHEIATPKGMVELKNLSIGDHVCLSDNNYHERPNVSKVKSITEDVMEDVYDATIPDIHNFVANGVRVHNCLEISLESAELCNLVETVPIKHKDLNDFLRTLKYAYLFGKTITLRSLHWAETTRVVLRNRRIGTSVTGITQFLAKHDMNTLKTWLDQGYQEIRRWDEIYSDWFCIPRSIKVTAIKPSGTLSLIAGVTPGMHFPESKYYIRRVRLSRNSHLIPGLKDKGFKIEPCVGSEESTSVVEIPVYIGEVRTIDDVTMWEQLELAAFLQHYYADNQVSCTVTFNKEEGKHIAAALNTYQYRLKGISFLPRFEGGSAYPQMPYEKITKEKYEEIVAKQKGLGSNPSNKRGRHHPDIDMMPDAVMFCDSQHCAL